MKDLNKVMLIGNLTRDPESRFIPSGQAVTSFTLATNRRWKGSDGEVKDSAEFTDIVAWGKLAEIAEQILRKGRRAYVEGRLQSRSWEGQDGAKRNKTEVVASDIIVLDKKGAETDLDVPEEAPEEGPKESKPEEKSKSKDKEETAAGAEEVDLDDIPF